MSGDMTIGLRSESEEVPSATAIKKSLVDRVADLENITKINEDKVAADQSGNKQDLEGIADIMKKAIDQITTIRNEIGLIPLDNNHYLP